MTTTSTDTQVHRGRVTASATRERFWLNGDRDGSLCVRGDGGYTIAFTALMIIPLMVMVSFAVDLGAWYAQGSRMQRAADAAAMAGVVWMPSNGTAQTAAQGAATANGYSTGITTTPVGTNQYQVTITAPVPRFFSGVFGTQAFNMTRSATAAYNKPIPMGSPTNKFGNAVTATNNPSPPTCPQFQPTQNSPCGPQPMLWSAIQSPYESFTNGDPYATKCERNGSSGSRAACDNGANANGADNTLYRASGYTYAVDVAQADVGLPMTIWVYDAMQITRTTGNSTSGRDCRTGSAPFGASFPPGFSNQNCQTGDSSGYEGTGGNDGYGSGSPLDLQLFDNDGSDLVISVTTPLACHLFVPTSANTTTQAVYKNKWATVCTFTPTVKGIYPMRVRSSGFGNGAGNTATPRDRGTGYNAYALQVTGGTGTQLYAVDDMSIWTNLAASNARFYLAKIGPEHKGKKIQIDLYDPGDGGGTSDYFMQVLAPPAGAPATVPTSGTVIPSTGWATSCTYNATPSATKGPATPNSSGTCNVKTKSGSSSGGIYNNSWLRVEILIDPNYTCTTDCWWTIKYDFGAQGAPTDRTVWSLKVVGDPVRLIQ